MVDSDQQTNELDQIGLAKGLIQQRVDHRGAKDVSCREWGAVHVAYARVFLFFHLD